MKNIFKTSGFKKTKKSLNFFFDTPKLLFLFFYSKVFLNFASKSNKDYLSGIRFPSDYRDLMYEVHSLMNTDLYLRWYMGSNAKRSYWHRAIEYSTLLGFFDNEFSFKQLKILDIGTGNSTYPVYFLKKCAQVTSIDVSSVMGGSNIWSTRKNNKYGLKRVVGDMLDMPFDEGVFDIVTSISVIEHLNESFNGKEWLPVNNDEFVKRTSKCISEMVRVLKPGGIFYVTSDIFYPNEAELDELNNPSAIRHRPGYTLEEFNEIWIPTLKKEGIELQKFRSFSEKNLENLFKYEPKINKYHKRPVIFLGIKK